jgi:hypothetical protein
LGTDADSVASLTVLWPFRITFRPIGYEFAEPDPVATRGYPATVPGIEMRDAHTFELPYVFGPNGTDALPDRHPSPFTIFAVSRSQIGLQSILREVSADLRDAS